MTTYKQLQCDPTSRGLFGNRITTVQGLCDALKDSAFIAIDTEHFAVTSEKDRVLHQVGLAHLKILAQGDPPQPNTTTLSTSQPRLQDFYNQHQIQALTLNNNLSKEKRGELTYRMGGREVSVRHSHRFGQEQRVDVGDLEKAIIDFIQRCGTKANPSIDWICDGS